MSERERLPNRRPCEQVDLDVGGVRHTTTFGRYDDGRLGEIFITSAKVGSAADTAARDAAIMASIALQYGAPAETLRRALCRDARGAASGPLGVALDLIASRGAGR